MDLESRPGRQAFIGIHVDLPSMLRNVTAKWKPQQWLTENAQRCDCASRWLVTAILSVQCRYECGNEADMEVKMEMCQVFTYLIKQTNTTIPMTRDRVIECAFGLPGTVPLLARPGSLLSAQTQHFPKTYCLSSIFIPSIDIREFYGHPGFTFYSLGPLFILTTKGYGASPRPYGSGFQCGLLKYGVKRAAHSLCHPQGVDVLRG